MAVLQGRTREQLRVSVGRNLMGPRFHVSSTTSAGSDTTSVIDTRIKSGADDNNGGWVVSTSGDNDGEIRRVTDDNGSGDLTVDAFSNNVPSGMTFELWEESYSPDAVHAFFDQAMINATGRFYDPIVDLTLHGDNVQRRFDMPSNVSMISRIDRRSYVASTDVHLCDRKFDETEDSDITQTVDTEDKKEGSAALKLTVAVGLAAGDFISDSITSTDMSDRTHLEGWIKSTVALSAADYKIHLDNGTVTADGNDKESLSIPAVSSTLTWTHFRIALANPLDDTAIVSVGLEMNVDKGAHTVWLDGIKAIHDDTQKWSEIPRHTWRIDKPNTEILFEMPPPYSLIRLSGGDKPALLTADSTATEVPDQYIIAYATARALLTSERKETDADVVFWLNEEKRQLRNLPVLTNVRAVS